MTGIIVLNYKGAADTVACLESLLKLTSPCRVYVLDNASGDGSAETLQAWFSQHGQLENWRLELIPKNLGFAGGNNVGIRQALADGCSHCWLLNNDTVVAPDSLEKMEALASTDQHLGILGACLLEYHQEKTIQCFGGAIYNWYTTGHRLVGQGQSSEVLPKTEPKVDFILGASMFIPAAVINKVGLLSEDYFLYYEELDYAQRCAKQGFHMRVCMAAKVWHKHGASIGSSSSVKRKSAMSAYYATRNTILFTRKFRPHALVWVLPIRLAWAGYVGVKGEARLVRPILRGLFEGLNLPLGQKTRQVI
jgi:GT2 family glycosyltransferase